MTEGGAGTGLRLAALEAELDGYEQLPGRVDLLVEGGAQTTAALVMARTTVAPPVAFRLAPIEPSVSSPASVAATVVSRPPLP